MATIGTTGAPSQNTVNYDALLSSTLDAYVGSGSFTDNIFKDSAFLAALRTKDAIQMQNGGERIRAPLMYGSNSTVKSYSGYETLNTTPQDGMTTAFYEWREIAATISISRKEQRQNSGEAQIIELLQAKVRQAEMSIREAVNLQLVQGAVSSSTFVPGNDAKDLNPLGWFLRKDVTADPVAGGNVGNIAASNSWWRPMTAVADSASTDTGNVFALAVTTYKGFNVFLKRLYNHCSKGSGGSPNLFLFDQVSYETYESSLDDKVRYLDTKMADQGFDALRLRGATCVWDEVVPNIDVGNATMPLTSGTVFALNTNHYKLVIDSETDFVTTPFIEPENQTAKTAKVLFMANAVCNNLRKLGVGYAISQTIAS
jgi:hypothetical protein